MMDDKKLDDMLMVARTQYRVPPEPSREAIWVGIESEAFAPSRVQRGSHWQFGWKLAAASLIIGVFAGRMTARIGGEPASTMANGNQQSEVSVVSDASRPYQQTTEEVLGRSAVLLAALRSSDVKAIDAGQMSNQATRLLGRVRLLLDSPAANDPQVQNLLLDLETTLAQIARMQPSRGKTDINLINEAVAQRDIVPRIQSVVVDLSAGGY
jgi:uncharacterized membrane-anchored protein YhcB (DUF1043 family)